VILDCCYSGLALGRRLGPALRAQTTLAREVSLSGRAGLSTATASIGSGFKNGARACSMSACIDAPHLGGAMKACTGNVSDGQSEN
jgi:hypothetical protein